MPNGRTLPRATIYVEVHPKLKGVLQEHTVTTGKSMNEIVASILAKKFGRPELAEIPRHGVGGRPKKEVVAAAS